MVIFVRNSSPYSTESFYDEYNAAYPRNINYYRNNSNHRKRNLSPIHSKLNESQRSFRTEKEDRCTCKRRSRNNSYDRQTSRDRHRKYLDGKSYRQQHHSPVAYEHHRHTNHWRRDSSYERRNFHRSHYNHQYSPCRENEFDDRRRSYRSPSPEYRHSRRQNRRDRSFSPEYFYETSRNRRNRSRSPSTGRRHAINSPRYRNRSRERNKFYGDRFERNNDDYDEFGRVNRNYERRDTMRVHSPSPRRRSPKYRYRSQTPEYLYESSRNYLHRENSPSAKESANEAVKENSRNQQKTNKIGEFSANNCTTELESLDTGLCKLSNTKFISSISLHVSQKLEPELSSTSPEQISGIHNLSQFESSGLLESEQKELLKTDLKFSSISLSGTSIKNPNIIENNDSNSNDSATLPLRYNIATENNNCSTKKQLLINKEIKGTASQKDSTVITARILGSESPPQNLDLRSPTLLNISSQNDNSQVLKPPNNKSSIDRPNFESRYSDRVRNDNGDFELSNFTSRIEHNNQTDSEIKSVLQSLESNLSGKFEILLNNRNNKRNLKRNEPEIKNQLSTWLTNFEISIITKTSKYVKNLLTKRKNKVKVLTSQSRTHFSQKSRKFKRIPKVRKMFHLFQIEEKSDQKIRHRFHKYFIRSRKISRNYDSLQTLNKPRIKNRCYLNRKVKFKFNIKPESPQTSRKYIR